MALVCIVFNERFPVKVLQVGEVDLVGLGEYWHEKHFNQECSKTLKVLYALQQDKDESYFEDSQRRFAHKLLATLWQQEGEVDYPVLLFGAAKEFLHSDQELLSCSKTMHVTVVVGGYHSWGHEHDEVSDYPVKYLCLYVFQDAPLVISTHDAIDQATQMCAVAEEYLKELRSCYGEWSDSLNRPYSDNFPEPVRFR